MSFYALHSRQQGNVEQSDQVTELNNEKPT